MRLAALGFSLATCASRAPTPPTAPSLDSLSWLAGTWRAAEGTTVTEERWDLPRAGALRGASRTHDGPTLAQHELLRIVARGASLSYEAAPEGQPPAAFALTRQGPGLARFENAAHDFPKWIEYRRSGDTLVASIGGGPGQRAAQWTFTQVAPAAPSRELTVRVCRSGTESEVTVNVAPCTCGAEVLCADADERSSASLALAVFDSDCDACLPGVGRCHAPRAARDLAGADGGCSERTVLAVLGRR